MSPEMNKAQRKAENLARWMELVKIEPELLDLEKEALAYKKASRGKDYVCANDRWYGYGEWEDRGLRIRIIYLVGWLRKNQPNPILKSCESYSVAYQHVYHLLPDCKNCGCLGRGG